MGWEVAISRTDSKTSKSLTFCGIYAPAPLRPASALISYGQAADFARFLYIGEQGVGAKLPPWAWAAPQWGGHRQLGAGHGGAGRDGSVAGMTFTGLMVSSNCGSLCKAFLSGCIVCRVQGRL